MTRQWQVGAGVLVAFAVSLISGPATAQYAAAVVSYDAGTTPHPGYNAKLAALGSPERFTGENVWPGAVSPFNPAWATDELISVGEGGQLTLRLSNYAVPQAGGPEIGVFTNASIIDTDYPNGQAGSPLGALGVDSAVVDVSANGTDWVSLGEVIFDIPTNGYIDLTSAYSSTPGSVESDFQQPFTGTATDFGGLPYYDAGAPDMLDLLAGSGGGTWLDISGTGLAQVGYVRFSVADDLNSGTWLNFELDAVSVSHAAMGAAIVPEPTGIILAGLALAMLASRLGRRRQH